MAQDALFDLLRNGALVVAFRLAEHIAALHRLLRKYQDTPMSLADACVVRMAEINENHSVLTLDSDFTVYRKHGHVLITLDAPHIGPCDRINPRTWAVYVHLNTGPIPRPADNPLKSLVGVRGFEPPAPASRTQCSTRLSYTPAEARV